MFQLYRDLEVKLAEDLNLRPVIDLTTDDTDFRCSICSTFFRDADYFVVVCGCPICPECRSRCRSEIPTATCLLKCKNHPETDGMTSIRVFRSADCGICLEQKTQMLVTKCGHVMCSACAERWFLSESKCPLCRQPYECLIRLREERLLIVAGLTYALGGYYGWHFLYFQRPAGLFYA
ncbi:hypothetical protein M0657_011965 [Pyricularia oryzae]|nr:hypothetical protein M0657_011965 [Pyricularia oryzae]